MKIYFADILLSAANDFLYDGVTDPEEVVGDYYVYSCDAISNANYKTIPGHVSEVLCDLSLHCLKLALFGLGADTTTAEDLFYDCGPLEEDRQGARYMWLIFAAMVAAEENWYFDTVSGDCWYGQGQN